MEDILGFDGTKEDILKIWVKNAEGWLSAGPPWRPSAGDIEVYKNLCGSKISGRVLILGSTSELRDLVALENNSPVLADISPAMLQKMSSLTKVAKPENEVWIKSDWCEAPLPENYFDLVIGDMVWWVVSVDYQLKLRDKIASLLKPDGLFVSRFRLREPDSERLDSSEVIKKYLAKFENNPASEILIRNAMMSRLYDITVDMGAKRLNRGKAKSILLNVAQSSLEAKHRTFFLEAASRLLSADWTSQIKEEILPLLEDKFRIVSEMRASDYESEFYPIFSFTPLDSEGSGLQAGDERKLSQKLNKNSILN